MTNLSTAKYFVLTSVLISFIGVTSDVQALTRQTRKESHHRLEQPIDDQAIKRVEPYNDRSHLRINSDVVVRVTVNEKGDVISARAISGHPLLYSWAVAAARKWKFNPKRVNGNLVKNQGTITFHLPPGENAPKVEEKMGSNRKSGV